MKIYEIGTGYTPIPAQMGAATEIVVEELTRAFLELGERVEIIDIAANERASHNLPIREVKVPKCFSGTDVKLGIMHKLKRVVYSVALAGELKKILKQTDEKVVLHFHNQYNMFFFLKLVPKRLRKKAILAYTVHSYVWPDEWNVIESTIRKRYFQEVYSVQNADCVFVLNDKTTENFVDNLFVSKEKIHKIGNGVNTTVYCRRNKQEIESFKKDNFLEGKKVIFQVGSICERKNQLGGLKTLTEYLMNNPETVYVYAGGVIDGDYQRSILDYVKERGLTEQVRYLGELSPGETLNGFYNAADFTIFPSTIESFGLVIIESISSGTPVLLFNQPVFSLEFGYSVCSDENNLNNCIDSLVIEKENFDRMHEEVVNNYSWKKVAKDYLAVWKMEK